MLATVIALLAWAPQTFSIVPKETIWVYANASTPADGTYLRAWGTDGKSCPGPGEDVGDFSFSYLKWELPTLPVDAKLTSAKLVVSNIPDPGFTVDSAKKSPLEARVLEGTFEAKSWVFDMASKVRPTSTKEGVYGTGYPTEIKSGNPVEFSVDLLKGPADFSKALKQACASESHTLSFAITSSLDPSVDGRSYVYKLYGQADAKTELRPKLVLTYESGSRAGAR